MAKRKKSGKVIADIQSSKETISTDGGKSLNLLN
jgi:hypothetical protein